MEKNVKGQGRDIRLADFLKQKQPVEAMAAEIKEKGLTGRVVDMAERENPQ